MSSPKHRWRFSRRTGRRTLETPSELSPPYRAVQSPSRNEQVRGRIEQSPPSASPLVVAAIDFGTHGTGFAWAVAADLDKDPNTTNINYYTEWAGTLSSYPKNLSALLLDSGEVKYWGHDAKRRWARAVAEGEEGNLGYAYAFKMALKPSQYADALPRGQGRLRVQTPQDAYPLIVAYLQKVKEVALKEITQSGYPQSRIYWCVTVPAIWDAPDQALMRRAAVDAGLPGKRLLLAREPEAAALQCRVHMARLSAAGDSEHHNDLRTDGSRFVVVDCGGGTVDITAYKVVGSSEREQQLAELCKASGGKFGSEYINRAFVENALTRHFGSRGLVDTLQQEFPQEMLDLVDQWEREKVNVQVRSDDGAGKPHVIDPILLNVPYPIVDFISKQRVSPDERADYRIKIEPAEIEALFESAVAAVLKEIEGRLEEVHLNAGPPAGTEVLLLVGGFAGSKYLQESIRSHFGDKVTVIIPDNPAGAVMFGAVRLCHRPTTIRSRRARYSYGYECFLPAESPADDERNQTPDDDGVLHCRRFLAAVRAGESVEVGKATEEHLFPLLRSDSSIVIDLLASTQRYPRYADEPGVTKLGVLSVNISESTGQQRPKREVLLGLHFGEAEIRAEASNPRTGAKYRTKVEFNYY